MYLIEYQVFCVPISTVIDYYVYRYCISVFENFIRGCPLFIGIGVPLFLEVSRKTDDHLYWMRKKLPPIFLKNTVNTPVADMFQGPI